MLSAQERRNARRRARREFRAAMAVAREGAGQSLVPSIGVEATLAAWNEAWARFGRAVREACESVARILRGLR